MDDAQNSAPAAKKPRGRGRPFKPGQSGNPGGRPRGIMSLVRESTRDGAELVEFALKVLRSPDKELDGFPLTMGDKKWACDYLADRGFGKAAQSVALTGEDGAPLAIWIDLGEK